MMSYSSQEFVDAEEKDQIVLHNNEVEWDDKSTLFNWMMVVKLRINQNTDDGRLAEGC